MWIIKFYSFDLDLHLMTLILKLNPDIEQTGRLDWNYYLSAWADGKQAVACTYFKSHMNCVKTYFLQAKVLARSSHMCRGTGSPHKGCNLVAVPWCTEMSVTIAIRPQITTTCFKLQTKNTSHLTYFLNKILFKCC